MKKLIVATLCLSACVFAYQRVVVAEEFTGTW